MRIDNDILYNILTEFKRKDVDKFKKAVFLRDAMKETGLSNRKFAAEFDIPLTTLKDWLVYDKITPAYHKTLKQQGVKETQIFRALRNGKNTERLDAEISKKQNKEASIDAHSTKRESIESLDSVLRQTLIGVAPHLLRPHGTRDTADLLIECINKLRTIQNRLEMKGYTHE